MSEGCGLLVPIGDTYGKQLGNSHTGCLGIGLERTLRFRLQGNADGIIGMLCAIPRHIALLPPRMRWRARDMTAAPPVLHSQ